MKKDILITGVLFLSIPLIVVDFGNRYSVLTNPVRYFHDDMIHESVSPKDAERFLLQFSSFRDRLRLIGSIQSCAVISFLLAPGAMLAAYCDKPVIAGILLIGSILVMLGLMQPFTREIRLRARSWAFICPTSRHNNIGNNL